MNRRQLLKGLLAAPLALIGVKALEDECGFVTLPPTKWIESDATFTKITTMDSKNVIRWERTARNSSRRRRALMGRF